jgi:branched-chain amino acid transport system substrate-binding protein
MKRKIISAAALSCSLLGVATAAPLKLAVIESLSGPQASTGLLLATAVKYQVEQINAAGGWNGEPLVVAEYDNQGGPAGASAKLKAAVDDGAQIIVQGGGSVVAGQLTEDVRKYNLRHKDNKLLFLNVGAGALDLTGEKCQFYHFRFISNTDMTFKALILAMRDAGVLGTKVYSIYENYSAGVDIDNAVKKFAGLGRYSVVGSTGHELNKIQDFSPYIAKIKASGAQTVLTGNWSNDLLLLMKAANNAGLKARFGTNFLDQPGNLANAGSTALGYYIAHPFDIEATGEASEKFAEDYKKKTGHYPSYVEPSAVFGIMMFGQALKTVPAENGKLDVTKLALALEKTTLVSPMGKSTMRAADHQILLPIVVSQVSKDAKYKVDGTDMGFKPVRVLTAAESEVPVQSTCKMQRPG